MRVAFRLIPAIGAALLSGCASEPVEPMDDPLHAHGPKLPPEELGLPPNPATAHLRAETDFAVPPPPITKKYWPCSECHDEEDVEEINTERRELVDDHRRIVLEHDEEHRWCLDCHNVLDRDKLRLASGELIGFDTSYLLCGQCHGEKLRDWKAGVHGKRTGMWRGEKKYLLCAHCHDPHSPRFRPIEPLPPPARPEDIL